jgi:hypothetical protein
MAGANKGKKFPMRAPAQAVDLSVRLKMISFDLKLLRAVA